MQVDRTAQCAMRTAQCTLYAVISQQAPRLGMVPVPRCPPREHAFGPWRSVPRAAGVRRDAQRGLRTRKALGMWPTITLGRSRVAETTL